MLGLLGLIGAAAAQVAMPATPAKPHEPTRPLALPQDGGGRVLRGTGFFVDEKGYLLTARHAVDHCASIAVTKETHRFAARLVALSERYDLALLKLPRTLGLAAVFPRTAVPGVDSMVFASAYSSLSDVPANRTLLANSRVLGRSGDSESGHLVIDSSVGFGTSGAPVLDGHGLVQGVISRRTMANRVLAVGADEAKAFLAAHGVRVEQDDRPQLAAGASRAARAASLSVQVSCQQY